MHALLSANPLVNPLLRPFGVDFLCLGKKFLVFNLVGRNLKIKYRRSVFGVFWTLLSPLASAGVYYFVFQVILKVPIPNYLVFILSGYLPWALFSQTVMEGLESLVGNGPLISKIPIPLQLFPFVGALTNLITFMLALPILLGFVALDSHTLDLPILTFPYFVGALFLITYCFSLIVGVLFVYFRDLRHVMAIIMQIWFYATPVVYDEKMLEGAFGWLLYLNPVGTIFASFHSILARGEWPPSEYFLASGIWVGIAFLVSILVMNSLGKGVPERI